MVGWGRKYIEAIITAFVVIVMAFLVVAIVILPRINTATNSTAGH
jgi:hypothetical protein